MLIDIRVKFAMSVFHLLATLTNKKTKPKFSVHLHSNILSIYSISAAIHFVFVSCLLFIFGVNITNKRTKRSLYPSFPLSSPVGIETLHLSAPSEFMSNTRKLSENFLTTLKRREIVINDTSQNNVKETMCFGASYSPQRSLLQVKWVCFDET